MACVGAVACEPGTQQIQSTFATDFNCSRQVSVRETLSPGRFIAYGCGRRVVYQCGVQACAIQTVYDPEEERATRESVSAARQPERFASTPKLEERGDSDVLTMQVPLDERAQLRVTAAPKQHPDLLQLKLIRRERNEDVDECNLDLMLDGQVVRTPKASAERDKTSISHRVQLSGSLIGELGAAGKISLRTCDERWALSRQQVAGVRGFVERFNEEVAWKSAARPGGTGSMPPPSGGWPAWSAVGEMPASVAGPELAPPALFKKLSASVFRLEAVLEQGVSQGSAVSISPSELLTNCHVVKAALKLVLKQGKHTWPAQVVRADPATDRCVVAVTGAAFQPVSGVRSLETLEVGEAAYTLGAPVGLEWSLSDGIISGRREDDGQRYIQTTAPISPGSSGGALFDARGNLIGITTLVLVGRERLNQSLNFAIPAETFFEP